jgi:hypothetical protein
MILEKTPATPVVPENKPNELGGIEFSSHVRITDPNTGTELLNMRAD